jgi:hypothetical protein
MKIEIDVPAYAITNAKLFAHCEHIDSIKNPVILSNGNKLGSVFNNDYLDVLSSKGCFFLLDPFQKRPDLVKYLFEVI